MMELYSYFIIHYVFLLHIEFIFIAFRAILWTRVDKLFNTLVSIVSQVLPCSDAFGFGAVVL